MREVQFDFSKNSCNKKEVWWKKHLLKIFSFILIFNIFFLTQNMFVFSPTVDDVVKMDINNLYLNHNYSSSKLTPEEIEILLKTLKPVPLINSN